MNATNLRRAPACLFAVLLISALVACTERECPECDTTVREPLVPGEDMAAYLDISDKVLYVLPEHEQMALEALNAEPLEDGRFGTTITPREGTSYRVSFKTVVTGHPYLFKNMDTVVIADIGDAFDFVKDIVDGAAEAAKDAAADAAAEEAVEEAAEAAADAVSAAAEAAGAVADAAGGDDEEEDPLSWTQDLILFDHDKGVVVWKNARCGTPRPRTVSACQGPIPADGEELEGMYWRTTAYSKAECEKGNGVCTELLQVGSYIEIAEDNQCNIVKIVRPVGRHYYCQ